MTILKGDLYPFFLLNTFQHYELLIKTKAGVSAKIMYKKWRMEMMPRDIDKCGVIMMFHEMHFVLGTEIDFDGFQSLSAFLIHAETLVFWALQGSLGTRDLLGAEHSMSLNRIVVRRWSISQACPTVSSMGQGWVFGVWVQRVRVPVPSRLS